MDDNHAPQVAEQPGRRLDVRRPPLRCGYRGGKGRRRAGEHLAPARLEVQRREDPGEPLPEEPVVAPGRPLLRGAPGEPAEVPADGRRRLGLADEPVEGPSHGPLSTAPRALSSTESSPVVDLPGHDDLPGQHLHREDTGNDGQVVLRREPPGLVEGHDVEDGHPRPGDVGQRTGGDELARLRPAPEKA